MFLLEIHFCLKPRFETFALSYKAKRLFNFFYSTIEPLIIYLLRKHKDNTEF